MDNLDRMFRHLVRTIEARKREYLTRPFEVAELYQTILPYRLHRRELGLDTNQDYELTLLQLLSGARGYLVVDDKMRDALRKELAGSNPDPTILREYASAHVALASDAVRRLETPEARDAHRVETEPSVPAPPAASSVATPPPARRAATSQVRSITIAEHGESCRFCGGTLPAGRQITFCPHCGQNLTVINCEACGTELELGWSYCTTCGRSTTAE